MKTLSKKQAEAVQRQQAFHALTTQEKLDKLISAGYGDCREANKYRRILDEMPPEKPKKQRKRDRKGKK